MEASHSILAASKAEPMDLRAGERVLQYLLSEFDRPDAKGGSRLPTNKELATRLNVSPGTVQSVLKQLAQKGRIHARRGSGTFLLPSPNRPRGVVRIAISVPVMNLQADGEWTERIGGGMFRAALSGGASIEGIAAKTFGTEAMIDELLAKKADVDALILMPYTIQPRHEYLIKAYENDGKPVVHVHSRSLIDNTNSVTSDYFGFSYRIGRAWSKAGRRRILMLSEASKTLTLQRGVSEQQRFSGLMAGLGVEFLNEGHFESVKYAKENQGADIYDSLKKRIAGGTGVVPDAIYFAGSIARIQPAVKACEEAGLKLGRDVSIVNAGASPTMAESQLGISGAWHDLEEVGGNAVEMALRRIELKGLSMPGVSIPVRYVRGTSTSPEEDELLADENLPI